MGNRKGHLLRAVFSLVKIHPQILFSFISELGNLAPPAAARPLVESGGPWSFPWGAKQEQTCSMVCMINLCSRIIN